MKAKTPTAPLILTIIVSFIACISKVSFAEQYLFDLLAEPAYYKSWNALFSGEKNIDPWLTLYAKTKNGPATPGTTIQRGEISYQLNMVCKTHDCGDNKFFVLFAPGGTNAWGLLLKDQKTERFFGNPDDEMKKALRAAAYE